MREKFYRRPDGKIVLSAFESIGIDRAFKPDTVQHLADTLPEGVNWGDPLTPEIAQAILAADPRRQCFHLNKVVSGGVEFCQDCGLNRQ